jgi:hypothetical protein
MTTDVKPRSLTPEAPFISGVRGGDDNFVPVPGLVDANETYIPEAPEDGRLYGRRGADQTWRPLTVFINESLEGDGDGTSDTTPLGVAPASDIAPGILSVPGGSALTLVQIATIPPSRSVNMTLGMDVASGQDVLDGVDDVHPITPAALADALRQGLPQIDARYVETAGDTMSGDLTVETDLHVEGHAFGPLIPTADEHLANKLYVDSHISGTLTLIGTFDASTGQVTFSYASGVPNGPLPPADATNENQYVIVSVAGLPPIGPPETQIICRVGDWWVSDGTEWLYLPIGGDTIAAINVSLIPQAFGEDNVQAAMEAADAQVQDHEARLVAGEAELGDLDDRVTVVEGEVTGKVAKTGDTMTGPLTLDSVPNINSGGQLMYAANGTARWGMGAELTGLQRFLIAGLNAGGAFQTFMAIDNAGMVQVFGDLMLDRPPTQPTHAAMKFYVDTQDDLRVAKAGDTMGGRLVLAVQPQDAMDAATKAYVDGIATGSRQIIGLINATNGRCVYSVASGHPPGPLISAAAAGSGTDIICGMAGTIPPDPLVPVEVWNLSMRPGDVLVSDGAIWLFIEIPHQTTVASQVLVIPSLFGANDVQAALAQAEIQDMPIGGTAGQVLAKLTGANYATEWIDPPTGGLDDDSIYMKQIGFIASSVDALREPSMSYTQGAPGLPGPSPGAWQIHTYNAGDGTNTYIIQELFSFGSAGRVIQSRWLRSWNGTTWTAWQQQIMSAADVSGQFLPLAGGTMTGQIQSTAPAPQIQLVSGGATRIQYFSTSGGIWTAGYDGNNGQFRFNYSPSGVPAPVDYLTLDGVADVVTVHGDLTVGRNLAVTGTASAAEPTANEHLATKAYVDRIVSSATTLIGAIDAGTGNCIFVNGTVGQVPDPADVHPGSYIACINGGTIPSGPAAGILMRPGDWIIDTGVGWFLLAVGSGGIVTTADQVGVVPAVGGTTNVQATLQVLYSEKVSKAGDNMAGDLNFASASPTRKITWLGAGGVAPPSTTGASIGTRLDLYPGANDAAAFRIGIESGSMWYNASSNHRFYTGAVQRMNLRSDALDMMGNYIVNVRNPGNSATDAANKGYVDARVAKTGDTMTGGLTISLGSNAVGIDLYKNNRNENTNCPSIRFRNSKGNSVLAEIRCVQESQWYAYQDFSRTEFWCGSGIMRRTFYGSSYTLFVPDGNVHARGFTTISDAAKKQDIAPADDDEVDTAFEHLRPVRYHWKPEMIDNPMAAQHGKSPAAKTEPEKLLWGFLAQDVERGSPDLVVDGKEGKGYDLAGIVAVMAAKIHQLEARLEAVGG